MVHKLNFETNELIVIRDAIHTITIRAIDAPLVASVLNKVYDGIEKSQKEESKKTE